MIDDGETDGYAGDVTVGVGGEPARTARAALAALAARFDPLVGHVVWSGRISAELPLRVPMLVTTSHGSARAEGTERDVWGNTRVSGIDRPPFPVEVLDAAGDR